MSACVYLSPAGNDKNSGESPSAAKLTLQAAHDALPPTGGVIIAAWGIYPNTNAVFTKPVVLQGDSPIGFGWAGGAMGAVFVAPLGEYAITAGTPLNISDPGLKIEGCWFLIGGIHIQRMRSPVLRDVGFCNIFQPVSGIVPIALYLDGTPNGFVEWAHVENCVFGNCPRAIVLNNADAAAFYNLTLGLDSTDYPNLYPGSIGIQTLGPNTDTLRIFGGNLNEYQTGINLGSTEGAGIEAASLYGLRVENHQNDKSCIGVLVSSNYNRIEGEYWLDGVGTAVKFLAGSGKNVVMPSAFTNVGASVSDAGTGNVVLGVS